MNKIVDIYLWGTKVGALGYEPGQTEVATLAYDKNFLKMGIEVSPLKVSIKVESYTLDNISKRTFHGLPGFIADALPDKFGNQLIDQYFALKGKTSDDITALDRLWYVGNRAMGALEFKPSIKLEDSDKSQKLKIQELAELSELVMTKKEKFASELKNAKREAAINLLRIGSSAGGARSKALVAIDKDNNLFDGTVNHRRKCKYYLLKFDSSSNSDRDGQDPKGMTRVEYIYSLLAKKCNIEMPHTDYIKDKDDFHFLIERFDRIDKAKTTKKDKVHYVSWCGMAHADRDTTGAYSYEQLVLIVRELRLGQASVLEVFRRAVFNIIGRNQDDHTKNFGFVMNRDGEWSLSPAFDMTYSYDPSGKWTRVHQISLNGKQDDFIAEDIVSFGKYCGISEKDSLKILGVTKNAFLDFKNMAIKYNVSNELTSTIIDNLRLEL